MSAGAWRRVVCNCSAGVTSRSSLRGFRIELGDIESVVAKTAGVRQCAVVAATNDKGDKSLVCYIVTDVPGRKSRRGHSPNTPRAHLPGYMVPTFWVFEDELPQTQNGKLNRKNLEDRGVPTRETNVSSLRRAMRRKKRLMQIWREVLSLHDMGVDDNLYALGADSADDIPPRRPHDRCRAAPRSQAPAAPSLNRGAGNLRRTTE